MTNYLIIAPNWIGDMVMAQSLFAYLVRYKKACIDVMAPYPAAELVPFMPEINQVFVTNFQRGQLNWQDRLAFAKNLKTKKSYDCSIVLTNSFKSALIPFWMKIPRRIGWLGEVRYVMLNDIRSRKNKHNTLMAEQFLKLGLDRQEQYDHSMFSDPKLSVAAKNIEETLNLLNLQVLQNDKRPLLVICPGSEFGPAKQWSFDHHAQLCQQMISKQWRVLLLGSPKDKSFCDAIMNNLTRQQQSFCHNLSGLTTLSQAVHCLSVADVMVAHDSGLMHIGAALNKPMVAIYGSTSSQHTPPLCQHKQIVEINGLACRPCFKRTCPLKHHDCMEKIEVHTVQKAIEKLSLIIS